MATRWYCHSGQSYLAPSGESQGSRQQKIHPSSTGSMLDFEETTGRTRTLGLWFFHHLAGPNLHVQPIPPHCCQFGVHRCVVYLNLSAAVFWEGRRGGSLAGSGEG